MELVASFGNPYAFLEEYLEAERHFRMLLRKVLQNSPVRDAAQLLYQEIGLLTADDADSESHLFDLLTAIMLEMLWLKEVLVPSMPFLLKVLENQVSYTH